MTRGWALIEQGSEINAIESIREGLAAVLATGASLMRPHFLALLAESLMRARKDGEALRALEEALETAHRSGEKSYQAELYRLKGELLLKQSARRAASRAATVGRVVVDASGSAMAQAEDCFNEAIQIAQRQKAKSLELRVVVSLARLYREQGNPKKAGGLLAPVYRGFTEGFDTIDFREAKALLEELA
jgi:adenylate cyclase